MRDPKFLWCAQVSGLPREADWSGGGGRAGGQIRPQIALCSCTHSAPLASYMNGSSWRQRVPSVTRPSVCAVSAR